MAFVGIYDEHCKNVLLNISIALKRLEECLSELKENFFNDDTRSITSAEIDNIAAQLKELDQMLDIKDTEKW